MYITVQFVLIQSATSNLYKVQNSFKKSRYALVLLTRFCFVWVHNWFKFDSICIILGFHEKRLKYLGSP